MYRIRACAAFREQKPQQVLQCFGISRVPQKLLVAADLDQPLVLQLLQMMGEGGRRDLEIALNIAHDEALRMGRQQQLHDAQSRLRTHRGEHVREARDFREVFYFRLRRFFGRRGFPTRNGVVPGAFRRLNGYHNGIL